MLGGEGGQHAQQTPFQGSLGFRVAFDPAYSVTAKRPARGQQAPGESRTLNTAPCSFLVRARAPGGVSAHIEEMPSSLSPWQDLPHSVPFPHLQGREVGVEMVLGECPVATSAVLIPGLRSGEQHQHGRCLFSIPFACWAVVSGCPLGSGAEWCVSEVFVLPPLTPGSCPSEALCPWALVPLDQVRKRQMVRR